MYQVIVWKHKYTFYYEIFTTKKQRTAYLKEAIRNNGGFNNGEYELKSFTGIEINNTNRYLQFSIQFH